MRRRHDDLSAFIRRLPLTLAVAVALWFVVKGVYNPALAWTAQGVSRVFEFPPAASIVARGDHAVLGRTDLRADSGRLQISLTQVHFNLVPFLALALALRRPFSKQGWQRLLAAIGLLAVSHVFSIVLKLKEFYASSLGEWSVVHYGTFARSLIAALRFFFDIPMVFGLPLLLWIATYPDQTMALLRFPDPRVTRDQD